MAQLQTEPRPTAGAASRRHPIAQFLMLDLLLHKDSRPIMMYAVAVVVAGTLAYHYLEGWSYPDSLYFVIITLTTIGYGDLTPTTALSRLLTVFYALNGVAMLFALFDEMRRVRRNLPEPNGFRDQ